MLKKPMLKKPTVTKQIFPSLSPEKKKRNKNRNSSSSSEMTTNIATSSNNNNNSNSNATSSAWPSPRESVIIVMDASDSKSSKGVLSMDALEWALKIAVRPGDTVIVLGVLCETFLSAGCNNNNNYNNNKNKNISNDNTNSCFPNFKFLMGIGISGICNVSYFNLGSCLT